MTSIAVKIVSKTETDPYPRYHGMCVDDKLDPNFWTTQTKYNLGINWGPSFSCEKSFDLSPGRHTIEYGVSCWVGKWTAEIYVNGALIMSGDVTVPNWLSGTFVIGPMGTVLPVKIPVLNTSMFLAKFPPITQSKSGILSNLMGILKRGGLRSRVRGK